VLVTKKDEKGNPVRANSRIVVLGNKDPHQWYKCDRITPVATQSALYLLISLAIEHDKICTTRRLQKHVLQIIVTGGRSSNSPSPQGCPFSKPNTFWRLRKIL
jgi:hypothetical protein